MWGKGWRFLWLLPLSLPLLAGDRDPFLPPEDRCQTAQLAQWRYGGAGRSSAILGGLFTGPS
ncbi:Protein of uncharacterised function (DUF2531) [Raoultella planticola]|uniref:Protein of uncharacterized function (DUF2531) n=1 Tax=Raoultella planticola TaxID=575 RepID=A0A485CLT0_RAOPL|nr:Protein of uncharacterised function (DUF2531) [Raoultella planticola]